MNPNDVILMLSEGERKAIAKSTAVAKAVVAQPDLAKPLVGALFSPNNAVVAHAAHALLTVFKENPSLLKPFVKQLLDAFKIDQWETLEQLAKILPGLELNEKEQLDFVRRLEQVYYEGASSIARTSALQALYDLSAEHKVWLDTSAKALKFAFEKGSKAMQARARKLINGN